MDMGLAITVIFSGLVIVFSALVGLTLLIYLIGWVVGGISRMGQNKGNKTGEAPQQKQPSESPAVQQAVTREPVKAEGVSGEVVAAISAAVAAMTGGRGIVRSVKRTRTRETRPVWAMAGLEQNTRPF